LGETYVGLEKMIECTGIGRSGFYVALAGLTEKGFVRKLRGGGRGRKAYRQVVIPPIRPSRSESVQEAETVSDEQSIRESRTVCENTVRVADINCPENPIETVREIAPISVQGSEQRSENTPPASRAVAEPTFGFAAHEPPTQTTPKAMDIAAEGDGNKKRKTVPLEERTDRYSKMVLY